MSPKEELLRIELTNLNRAVEDAVRARTAWMDAHMPDFSRVQVGEELFDAANGYRRLGIVHKLYRYWGGGRDWRYDTSMDVNYEYVDRVGSCLISNTSSQTRVIPVSKADKERYERLEYESLKRKFEPASV